MRILVVEDEPDLREMIVRRLEKECYSVDECGSGLHALDYIHMADYDAILLDIMLPGMNGFEVLKQLRSEKNKMQVLLLTARDEVDDRVRGLDLGADDYLIKPFSFEELLARIRVMIRRNSVVPTNNFEIGDLKVDCDARSVMRGAVPISLSTKEFSILEYMIRNQGIVLTREKISNHIWNFDYEGGSNVVDVYIRYLRKKIDDNFEKKYIHTIRGAGYVLREE